MNIFNLPPLPLPEELTTILAENGSVRIERIISTGQVSPCPGRHEDCDAAALDPPQVSLAPGPARWYDQTETEFVALLEGSAVIEYENGKTVALSKGDTILIQPHERHRVNFTSSEPPCVWLCVFY